MVPAHQDRPRDLANLTDKRYDRKGRERVQGAPVVIPTDAGDVALQLQADKEEVVPEAVVSEQPQAHKSKRQRQGSNQTAAQDHRQEIVCVCVCVARE